MLAGTLLVATTWACAATPRLDYMLHCMGCHRADGVGTPPGIPRLAGRVGYYLQVTQGRAYLAQVPGAAQSLLDDGALAGVLNWIVAEFGGKSAPAGFEPYTAEEVHRYRSNRPQDIGALRRRLAAEVRRVTPGS